MLHAFCFHSPISISIQCKMNTCRIIRNQQYEHKNSCRQSNKCSFWCCPVPIYCFLSHNFLVRTRKLAQKSRAPKHERVSTAPRRREKLAKKASKEKKDGAEKNRKESQGAQDNRYVIFFVIVVVV